MEYFANIKEVDLEKNGNTEIAFKFNIMDRQKAIDCCKFFFANSFKKKDNTETFLPLEIMKVFYDLKDESKRDIYEHMF